MNGLELAFVNVGYGEATVVRTKDFVMVIDGGSGREEEYVGETGRTPLARYLALHDIHRIDLMVCTHIHEDHLSGLLPVVRDVPVSRFWQILPKSFFRTRRNWGTGLFAGALDDACTLQALLEVQRTDVQQVNDTKTFRELAPGLAVRILAPSLERERDLQSFLSLIGTAPTEELRTLLRDHADRLMNNFSLVLLLEYAGRRILLPGDMNKDGFLDCPGDIHADLFKLGHHGQQDSADARLLERIRPSVVVCCASSDQRYHSADPTTLSLARGAGTRLFFSDCPPCIPPIPPHHAVVANVSPRGEMSVQYQM